MSEELEGGKLQIDAATDYLLENFSISDLSSTLILAHSAALTAPETSGSSDILVRELRLNKGSFTATSPSHGFPTVVVQKTAGHLLLSCPCATPKTGMCGHQVQVLLAIKNRKEIRAFFDEHLRHELMQKSAADYGLEEMQNLDDFFQLEYTTNRALDIKPKIRELFPISQLTNTYLQEQLLLPQSQVPAPGPGSSENGSLIVVLGQHRFYNHLYIEIFEAQTTREGKPKNPLTPISPQDLIWKTEKAEELKFYSAILKFQSSYSSTDRTQAALEGLKALVKNPLGLPFYYHNAVVSVNTTAASIEAVQLKSLSPELRLYVHKKDAFYEVTGQLLIEDKPHDLRTLRLRYNYFIPLEGTLHLIDTLEFLRVIDFFKPYNSSLLIHASKFNTFRENVLAKLEHKIRIHYSYVKPAPPELLAEQGFDGPVEQLIYLSDSEQYVLITPVMRYGQVEVSVLSRKQIFATDERGNTFSIERDEAAELEFLSLLLQQHPHFKEQLQLDSFYLHRDRFLEEEWFLQAFEEWQRHNIRILGFNSLKNNRLNPNKAKVNISVSSGVDWFDTTLDVRYGTQKVSLKQLHKSLRNKSRFVELGDGTLGILPTEWIERFTSFFRAGKLVDERLRTPKVNFTSIQELYEEEVQTQEVREQLALYQERLANFTEIEEVAIPTALKAELREYQKHGLQWLNFLDQFGFGGCLADDMGLGKTVQILAFILSQRQKEHPNINLVVVPTTLLFNWQAEVEKFAPSIKLLLLHGPGRPKKKEVFDQYEIVLTTYGTLLSDIRLLKQYRFNYIFLDESHAIKNPESQRYKAACLLQARNRFVLTGTPFENNSFDIYGQLSFACPGLLGTKQDFKEQYATLIDKFKDSKRARALQKKISPFILRRTKEQVAPELPDKTEMTIFCEMGTEQRRVYEAYAKEFRDFLLSKNEGDLDKHNLHVLQGLTKLRQICNSPALLNDTQFYSGASAKIETLMEQIQSKASHHKILVFSQFVGMLELIRKELTDKDIPYAYLTGQTKNREESVAQFQENDNVRVFLISLKAGGTGLNLTEADYVYLVDPWWNPAVENQAIDRVYRIGQQKNVVAVRLLCPETIEEKIMRLQETKTALSSELIRTDASMIKSLSRSQLLELFS